MTATRIIPVGPHADLYDTHRIEVGQFPREPAHSGYHDSLIPPGAEAYCPVCATLVIGGISYTFQLAPYEENFGFMIWAPPLTVGHRLDPCGHYVTAVLWMKLDTPPAPTSTNTEP